MISVGNPSILNYFFSLFYAVSMATGMHMDERSVDCLVLGHHDQDWKVSAKSVTMHAMTLCKYLSGYRELLLILIYDDKNVSIYYTNDAYKTYLFTSFKESVTKEAKKKSHKHSHCNKYDGCNL